MLISQDGTFPQIDVFPQPLPRVGYAFVQPQEHAEVYAPAKGLLRGTMFPELDLPMGRYEGQYTYSEVNK